jgi:hypothetical protein
MTQVATFDFGGKFSEPGYQDLLNKIDALPWKDTKILILGCREEDCNPAQNYVQTLALQQYIHDRDMQFCVLLNWFTQYTNESMPGIDVDYIDFMLLKTVYNNARPADFQHRPGILFLIGKPDRPHRAPLLYKFFEQNTLHHVTWSLTVPAVLENTVRELIPNASDQQWQQFLSLQGSPDNAKVMVLGNSIHIAHGFQTNPTLFQQTQVSLISESAWDCANDPTAIRVTEKTYKAIDNHHPFVIAGPPGTLARLKSMGYRTFEQYLPFPDYDRQLDADQRLEMVYQNILALNNQMVESNAIAEDVAYNYTVNRQRYHAELGRAESMLAKYGYYGSATDVLMMHDQIVPNTLTDQYMQLDKSKFG